MLHFFVNFSKTNCKYAETVQHGLYLLIGVNEWRFQSRGALRPFNIYGLTSSATEVAYFELSNSTGSYTINEYTGLFSCRSISGRVLR